MVTGSLARVGYAMGDDLYKPRAANPKGFFEDPEINGINEALLGLVVPASEGLGENQRWLAALPVDVPVRSTPAIEARIHRATARRPFCYKDPRFSHTLPAWRPHLGDAGMVCVFRHPLLTVQSVVKEVRTAAYLDGVPFDLTRGFALWASTYRAILERQRLEGDWLYLHYDQALQPEGLARLGTFLGVTPDASFPDGMLHRPPPEGEVPEDVAAIYAQLCELAGYRPSEAVRVQVRDPDVSVVVVVGPGESVGDLPALVADQRQVVAELVVVDTRPVPGDVPGARVVHLPTWSRGSALAAGVAAARGRHVATWQVGVAPLPSQLAHGVRALDAQPQAGVSLCDGWISRPPEQFVSPIKTASPGHPSAAVTAGAVWRREVLASVSPHAFYPGERALLDRLHAERRVVRVSEPGFHVDEARAARLEATGAAEVQRLAQLRRRASGPPTLSVVICTYNRCEVLRECLEAFCTQILTEGTFEVVLVDDGSTDGTEAALADLTFPVPVTRIRQANGGLAAARNAGIAVARGRLLHFVNDDTIPAPTCVAQHLAAHAAHRGVDLAVLGSFEQPPEALDNALMRACETGTIVFCYSLLKPGSRHPSAFFYTCNVSAPAARVRAVGGFDAAFRHYGAEDTDLGMRMGLPVLYHPAARAIHRHTWGFDYLARRNPMVARAHVRLFMKHPEAIDTFGVHEATITSLGVNLARRAVAEVGVEAAARGLATVDVGALERLGEGWKPYVTETVRRLQAVLGERNKGWWAEGFIEGLREHGLSGFPELLAAHPIRFDVPGEVVLGFPASDGDWRAVVRSFASARVPGRSLVLVVSPDQVDTLAPLVRDTPGVLVRAFGLHAGHQVRLLAGAAAWVPTGSAQDARVRRLAASTAAREEDPRAWDQLAPWPLVSTGSFRLLAWPRWDDDAALAGLLVDYGQTLADSGDGTLVLRLDPERDGPPEAALARLQAAGERVAPDLDLEVLLVDEVMGDQEMGRLLRAVDAVAAPTGLAHRRVVRSAAELSAAVAETRGVGAA